jgi:hypothetical protein
VATVTVVTAERTLEIEATSIVDGSINAAGHLILERQDGTPIDMGAVSGMQMDPGTGYAKVDAFSYIGATDPGSVPNGSVWYDTNDVAGPVASELQKGLVELATAAETQTGTDSQRAVTPAGLASLPGYRVQVLAANANTEGALPAAYPLGVSLMNITTGSGWSVNSGFGSIITYRPETDRTVQTAFSNPGGTGAPRSWIRQYHTSNNGGGWTAWAQYNTLYSLTAGSFTQTTAMSSYPSGWSRLYYTTVNSTSWDFAGKAGEVLTYVDGTDFAKQEWIKHVGGTAVGVETERWIRTANQASGWSRWRRILRDAILPDPAVSVGNTTYTVTATTWADHPATLSQTLTVPYDCIVSVELNAWLAISYTDASTVRCGVGHNLANPENSFGSAWGNVLYETTQGTLGGGGQHGMSVTVKLTAGTHTFKVMAFKTGTGAASANYVMMRVTPLRWAE